MLSLGYFFGISGGLLCHGHVCMSPFRRALRVGLCLQVMGTGRARCSRGRTGAGAGRRNAELSVCQGERVPVPLPEGQSCCSPSRSPAVARFRSSGAAPRRARGRGAAPRRDPAHRAAAPESLSAGYVSPLSSLPPLPFPVYLSRSTHTHAPIYLLIFR